MLLVLLTGLGENNKQPASTQNEHADGFPLPKGTGMTGEQVHNFDESEIWRDMTFVMDKQMNLWYTSYELSPAGFDSPFKLTGDPTMGENGKDAQQTNASAPVDLALMQEVFARYEGQQGALIPVLQQAQQIYGYLPKEVQQRIAERLGLSRSKIYGVATFYAQFYLEKRGRHILKLCDGTACHVKGTPVLMTALADRYSIAPGETSEDGNLTVEIVYCLGSCALAPVAVLDDEVLGRMRQDILLRALKTRMEAEQPASEQ